MKPRIVKLEPYGDYRDNKTSNYKYKLDFEKILYNLSLEDCQFILSVLNKNIMFGEEIENKSEIYNTFAVYSVYERGSERWVDISLKDTDGKLNWKSFRLSFDLESKHFNVGTLETPKSDGSATIMIYEYFLNK